MTTTTGRHADRDATPGAATPGDEAGPAATPAARLLRWWRRPGVGQAVVVLAPVLLVVVMAWDRRWMADDGFLHLRVADQVLHGNGPVFNAGERVETSTSPLWMWLLTALSFVTGVALPWKAVLAGLALTVVGMVAAGRAAVILARRRGDTGVVWPVGLAAVAALPPFWDFATSGLETGLAFGWIGASCWWVAARVTRVAPPSPPAEVAGAVLVSVGYSIRPDLGLFTVAFAAVLVAACRRRRRRTVAVVAALAAVPVANQVFRMGYYALLVPNTAVAKEASGAQWGPGWRYLTDLVLPYALWVPVGVVAVVLGVQLAGDRERRARLVAAARLAPAVAALAHALYITRVGGDFMHARLLLPAVFGLLAPVGVRVGAEALARPRLTRAAVVVIAAWAVLATFQLRPTSTGDGQFTTGQTIEDERRTWQLLTGMEHPVRNDVRVRRLAAASGTGPEDGRVTGLFAGGGTYEFVEVPLATDVPATAAGVFAQPAYAYDTDVYMIDTAGLAHPIGGHLDELSGVRMGHQKFMALAWQLAGFTPAGTVRNADGEVLVAAGELAAAERAAGCGQLATYLDGIREPLTAGRFLRNMVDSVANTTLRIPPDPREAATELCGD